MTDEKICPIMSHGTIQNDGDHLLATIYCQRERCMAWKPALGEEHMIGKAWDAGIKLVALTRGVPDEIAEAMARDAARGKCVLIERGA